MTFESRFAISFQSTEVLRISVVSCSFDITGAATPSLLCGPFSPVGSVAYDSRHMKQRRLGKTGWEVSTVGNGSWVLPRGAIPVGRQQRDDVVLRRTIPADQTEIGFGPVDPIRGLCIERKCVPSAAIPDLPLGGGLVPDGRAPQEQRSGTDGAGSALLPRLVGKNDGRRVLARACSAGDGCVPTWIRCPRTRHR